MSPTAVLHRPTFEPEQEARYIRQLLDRAVIIARVGSVAAAISFIAYGGWDLYLDSASLSATGPLRLATAASFGLVVGATYWQPIRTQPRYWSLVLLLTFTLVGGGFALILSRLPGGFVAGVPGFILAMIVVPTFSVRISYAAVALLPLIAFPNIVMAATEAGSFEFINANVWLSGGAAFTMIFAYLFDVVSRQAFRFEMALETEKERSESLLLNVLPAEIAERLKESGRSVSDSYAGATVVFADLVGFTQFSRTLPAEQLVALLNDLFSRFDDLVDKHDAEKIKTIGDAYMVVVGVPSPRLDHADVAACLALDMQREHAAFCRDNSIDLGLRIGMHSGGVVAGVIGRKRFAYDLWGDTVNVASRMESHGVPGEIQISVDTRVMLTKEYVFMPRGKIELKGHEAKEAFLLREAK